MDRSQIHFLRFLLEAYEGVAVLTTLDRVSGLVTLLIAPGREAELEQLLADVGEEMMITPVSAEYCTA